MQNAVRFTYYDFLMFIQTNTLVKYCNTGSLAIRGGYVSEQEPTFWA